MEWWRQLGGQTRVSPDLWGMAYEASALVPRQQGSLDLLGTVGERAFWAQVRWA